MTYGGTMPTLTASYSGFVNGDTSSSLTTAPTVTTTATAYNGTAGSGSGAGTYATAASGAVDSNYNISYVGGLLTIDNPPTPVASPLIPNTVQINSQQPEMAFGTGNIGPPNNSNNAYGQGLAVPAGKVTTVYQTVNFSLEMTPALQQQLGYVF
jgi:hypothetical protein